MKTFAIISGNIVSNTIVANTLEDALIVASNPVDITGKPVGIGFTYDAETGEFTAPVAPEPEVIVVEPAAIEKTPAV